MNWVQVLNHLLHYKFSSSPNNPCVKHMCFPPPPIEGSLSNDDGDGNKNGKKAIGLDWQNNNFARASRFFVHFFAVVSLLRRENAPIHVLSGTVAQENNFLFVFLNFDTVLWNSTPKKIANIWRIKRDGISVIKFKAASIHF